MLEWTENSFEVKEGDTYLLNGKERTAERDMVIVRQAVRVKDSAEIEPRARRAIAEVSQTDKGSLKIKMHDKCAALDKLARSLGMYQELEDAESRAQNLVAVNVYNGRPASTPPHGEPASKVPGDD